MRSLGLYIHIPFCKAKCIYCDFYSLPRAEGQMDAYVSALTAQLAAWRERTADCTVDTVYFGGGTPSYLGPDRLCRLLDAVFQSYRVAPGAEITLEANPDSVTNQSLKKLLRAGFNRISIGVQSDDDEMLKKLGRPHTYEQARQAVQRAREVGFANVSVDLMYGLPNQTLTGWKETVENVLTLKPDHLSAYALRVEEGTPLWNYRDCANLPDDDRQADMYLAACRILRDYGYEHYEISNFAKPGFASRHNLKYWNLDEYLGFGPSAASDFGGKRFSAVADLRGYIDGIRQHGTILRECDTIPMRERAGEYVMLRLRTSLGIEEKEYETRFLMPFKPLETLLTRFQTRGYTEKLEDGRWVLTEQGWLVSNQIIITLNEAQERSTPLAKKR